MEKQKNPETAAIRFNDCINRHDLHSLTDLMTDDYVCVGRVGQRVSLCTDERLNTRSIWTAQVKRNQSEEWRAGSDTHEV